MAALVSITVIDAEHVLAGFDAVVDAVQGAAAWSLVPVGAGIDCSVVQAEPRPGGLLVDLVVSPGMSKNATYRFTASNATAGGVPLAAPDKQFNVASGATPVKAFDMPQDLLAALVGVGAEDAAQMAGRPQTLLVDLWQNDLDVLPVESTLGFPSSGRIWVDTALYTYASRTATTFRGVAPVRPALVSVLSPKALVSLDLSSVA
jgi:hypothetical protein